MMLNIKLAVLPIVTVPSYAGVPVVEGIHSVTFTCVSSANPEAEFGSMREGGGRVFDNFTTLDIAVFNRTGMGTYT